MIPLFMCKVLQGIINSDPQLEVVGEAHDGRAAVAFAESFCPDVITMDIDMPHVNGLQATELIMCQHPRPIVIVSSETKDEEQSAAQALALGAIDFVSKPSGAIDLDIANHRRRAHSQIKIGSQSTRDSHRHPPHCPINFALANSSELHHRLSIKRPLLEFPWS